MKKHYKAYVSGFDYAKELRMKLMEAKDSKEVGNIIKRFLKDGTIGPLTTPCV
jgi:tRNA-dihydrouridine synthase